MMNVRAAVARLIADRSRWVRVTVADTGPARSFGAHGAEWKVDAIEGEQMPHKAWEAGLTSGMIFAMRRIGVDWQEYKAQVRLVEGRLKGSDATGVAIAASAAVLRLFNGNENENATDPLWEVEQPSP